MKRIFVISWCYPPDMSSESIVTNKLLKNSENEYTVFTRNFDSKLSNNFLAKNIKVINSKSNNIKEFEKESVNYLMDNIDKYDIFMTRSMPEFAHNVGVKIKKKLPQLKWIVSYSDPIFDSPYFKLEFINAKKRGIIKFLNFIKNKRYIFKSDIKYKKQFNYILKNADLIIFNNVYQRKYMMKNQYNKYKSSTVIIPHSYDFNKTKLKIKSKSTNNIIEIVYLGVLDKVRNPKFLFESLKRIKHETPEITKKISLSFYGSMEESDKLYAEKNLSDFVNIYDKVNYDKSLEIMQKADYLLIIDADLSKINNVGVYLPAKTFDYIGSNTPIIALTMKKSPTSDLLKELDQIVITYDYNQLRNTLVNLSKKHKETIIDKTKKYSAKKVSKILDSEIYKLEEKNE